MTKLITNIPKIVRQYRDKHDLTQPEFAELVRNALAEQGIESKFDYTFVSKIERGTDARRIDLDTLYSLSLVIDDINWGNIAVVEGDDLE